METTERKFTKGIERAVSETELAKAGVDLEAALAQWDSVEEDRKAAMQRFKDRLEGIDGRITNCRDVVKRNVVVEQVECAQTFYPNEARAITRRLDTDATVEERAMTAEELEQHRQLTLVPVPDNVADFAAPPAELKCAQCGAAIEAEPTYYTPDDAPLCSQACASAAPPGPNDGPDFPADPEGAQG